MSLITVVKGLPGRQQTNNLTHMQFLTFHFIIIFITGADLH